MKFFLNITLLGLILFATPHAKAFATKQDCNNKYLNKAQTEIVAQYYAMACGKLFSKIPEKIDQIDYYMRYELKEIVKDDSDESMFQKVYETYYSDIPRSMFDKLIEQKYLEKTIAWKQEKEWAECILKNKKLKKIKTDTAASFFIADNKELCR